MRHTLIAAAILAFATVGMASDEDALTSLSYIAYLERYATLQPASQQDSLEAVLNMPVVPGDRIDTARLARVELHLSDGAYVWLDQYTSVSFDAIALSRDTRGDRTVLFLSEGSIIVEIPTTAPVVEPMRIDGASTTLYLTTAGTYRIESQRSGGLRLEVWNGLAEAADASGGVLVRTGSVAEVGGGAVAAVESDTTTDDDFARWVGERRRAVSGQSIEHVDPRYARQAAVLDSYGSWLWSGEREQYVWQPDVDSSWRPYTSGRWYWTPTGWTWISYEPWGWLPHHYGSWSFSASLGWTWAWGPHWGPAWVSWMWWPGYVAWCPSGYYDWWYWGHRWPGGGGGQPGPPRGDVVPPRQVSSRLPAPEARVPVDPSRFALDLHGEVPLENVDPRGWNVVSSRDFASPNLTRHVEPGESALRGRAGERAVVVTGPLVTEAPVRSAPGTTVERAFLRQRPTADRDLSPILARDPSLTPEQAASLVRPTTTGELARRAPATTRPAVSAPRRAADGTPSTAAERPIPNIHRSTMTPRTRQQPVLGRTTPSRGTRTLPAPGVTVPRAPTTWRTGPDGRLAPGSAARPAPSTVRRPSTGVSPPGGRTVGGSRPIVVPRSTAGSSSRTPPTVRRPSGSRASPPARPSSGARPAPRPSGGGGASPSSAPRSASSSRPSRR